MKKLLILTVLLGTTVLANAQYGDVNREYNARSYDSRNYDNHPNGNRENANRSYDRNDRNYGWGYDKDYRVVNGRGGAINTFQRDARERIAAGIVEGTINSREAERLLSFAEKIEMKENRYMRNGRLTPNEVRELREDLGMLNRMIAKEKRDFDNAPVDRGYHQHK